MKFGKSWRSTVSGAVSTAGMFIIFASGAPYNVHFPVWLSALAAFMARTVAARADQFDIEQVVPRDVVTALAEAGVAFSATESLKSLTNKLEEAAKAAA